MLPRQFHHDTRRFSSRNYLSVLSLYPNHFPWDDLPAEIQTHILKYVVPNNVTLTLKYDLAYDDTDEEEPHFRRGFWCERENRFQKDLLFVSKKWAQQCIEIFYGSNKFEVLGHTTADNSVLYWLASLPDEYRSLVRRFSYAPACPTYAPAVGEDDNRWIVGYCRNLALTLPKLDYLHIDGIGKGLHDFVELWGHIGNDWWNRSPFNRKRWTKHNFRIVSSVVGASTSLKDGAVYCNINCHGTTICRAGYRYIPSSEEVLVDLDEDIDLLL